MSPAGSGRAHPESGAPVVRAAGRKTSRSSSAGWLALVGFIIIVTNCVCVCVCTFVLFCVVCVLFCAHTHTHTHLPTKLGLDTDTLPTPRNVVTYRHHKHGNMETYELV